MIILVNTISAAADIAYVVKNTNNPDDTLVNVMEELKTESGYTYELIDDSNVTSTNFSNYKLILVADDGMNNVPAVSTQNSIVLNNDYESLWGNMATLFPNPALAHAMFHEITDYNFGDFRAYTTNSIGMNYLYSPYNKIGIVALANDYSKYVIAAKENPRRIFFGIHRTDYWTAETKQLFKNSLKWAIKQQCTDADGDGYIKENKDISFCIGNYTGNNDCNDNNRNMWQNLSGYLDSDEDNFGIGNLINNVCSGSSLPLGYSDNNYECDDNNAGVNPDESEIPYDGIDQDCSNYDLLDSDEDGYCKTGFLILNRFIQCPFEKVDTLVGTDCDDDDAGINPGSADSEKSCDNHAPVIGPIEKITADETDEIFVTIIANDPDEWDNILVYSINDTRFIRIRDSVNENVFRWVTGYDNEGNYTFKASVSDGRLTSEMDFELEVLNTNRAPHCRGIAVLQWNQNANITADLKNNCLDDDNDALNFSVYNVSSENIYVSEWNNGIATVSSARNWFGSGWIIFKADDGEDFDLTNQIPIVVHHVNQAPEFNGNIENLNWNENANLTDAINLNDFFSDVDGDALVFSFSGNNFIDIVINNGLVSFNPDGDWNGQENITFSASDVNYRVNSNIVLLNVNHVNKPPVFEELNCTTVLLEDTSYNCQISAIDYENETISFSIMENSNLNCTIQGNTLNYIGTKDYYGNASCKIRARDTANSYSDKLLNVQIENVNDAPIITDYSPKNLGKIMANTDYRLSLSPFDSDSHGLVTNWTINNESIGFGNAYVFNKPKGNYQVIAKVSDEEYDISQIWNLITGNINDFSCSEMQGYVCAVNQTCSQSYLGVYDSDKCCAAACIKAPYEFKAVRNISASANKTGSLIISIAEPTNNDKFNIGDSFNVKTDVENKLFDYDIDADVEVYLYDLTKEKVIESNKEQYRLLKNTVKTINIDFNTEVDLNEDDEYAVLVRVIGEDKDNHKYYNQAYKEIGFNRKQHSVVIENMELSPENGVLCGDYVDVIVSAKNIGETNEDIMIILSSTNPELKLSEKTNLLKLEKYDEDDAIKNKFSIRIPENINSLEYTIRASVSFGDKIVSLDKKLNIECKQETTETVLVETIKLGQELLPVIPVIDNKRMITFLISSSVMITLVMIVLVGGIAYRNNVIKKRVIEMKLLENKNIKRKR